MEYDYSEQRTYIQPLTAEQIATKVREYFNKVYLWLASSMAISAGAAIYVTKDFALMNQVRSNLMVLSITTLVLVAVMCFASRKLTAGALKVLLLAYSALQGVILAPLLSMFTATSIGVTFASTAGMFGAMAIYGMTTKRNLSGLGRTLLMMLLGLIIASIANLFIGGAGMSLLISVAGVVIFSLFTAYDFQQLQNEGAYLEGNETRDKAAVLGALGLYINFYNLFLYLLRFLGNFEE